MNWAAALQHKRQQLVHAMVQARRKNAYATEQALITIIGQLGELETEFQVRSEMNEPEHEIIEYLNNVARKKWPNLWADMAASLHAGIPDEWLQHAYVIVNVAGEHIPIEGQEEVSFESRVNQLDSLPLTKPTIEEIDKIIDDLWARLLSPVEESRSEMEHWQYAARMNLLAKRLLALYSKVQLDAINAVKKAEEQGELTKITGIGEDDHV